ncbi:MAG TPA: DMT family transporter [Opitutaceae bacterium]
MPSHMVAAVLTTVFFSLSAVFAHRSIRLVGATRANLGRLLVAVVCLGLYAHTVGGGLGGAGLTWFLLSGLVGMGLGDLAAFAAFPLIGSRLTVLLTQCLAVPIAILAERVWLGTALTGPQLTWGAVILAGVAVALLPSRSNPPRVPLKAMGFFWGVMAAAGQGLGAVLSRKANELTALAGQPIDGITAAYQRIVGGLVITVAFFAVRALLARKPAEATPALTPTLRDHLWIPANALCGAVIGVSFYQWSLATTPSGLVLPIVACTPLVIVPLSYWLEGERPTRRSLLGGVIAVAGVVALTLVR